MSCSGPAVVISQCGARYEGIQANSRGGDGLVLFTDPITRTTLALLESDVTVENVQRKLREKHAVYQQAMLDAAAKARQEV